MSKNSQIKIKDHSLEKEEEAIRIEQDIEDERRIKYPTEKDKLKANTEGQLLKKDIITRKIKQEGKQLLRFYKFRHPTTGLMLFGTLLIGQELTNDMVKWGAQYISQEEYHRETNENYESMRKGKGKVKLINSLLDLEIVRSSPELEKKLKTG